MREELSRNGCGDSMGLANGEHFTTMPTLQVVWRGMIWLHLQKNCYLKWLAARDRSPHDFEVNFQLNWFRIGPRKLI